MFTTRALEVSGGGDVRVHQRRRGAGARAARGAAAGKDVWVVGGGELAGQFADAGLLDEVWVQYAPVTLGGRGAAAAAARSS